MRVLITNDDGIASEGIRTLAGVAAELGWTVVVAAPAWDSSGASASLTGVSEHGRLIVEDATIAGLPAVRAVGVHAAPALIVRAGIQGGFGPPPDMVLSGINHGPNTGQAVLHSGTVGAALTAGTHGCKAVAFSLGIGAGLHLDTAAEVARSVLPAAAEAPAPLVLNVNIPNRPLLEVRGVRRAPLASFGAVHTHITEAGEGYIDLTFSEIDPTGEPGSDATLLAEGFVTLTPLRSVCEANIDLPALSLP